MWAYTFKDNNGNYAIIDNNKRIMQYPTVREMLQYIINGNYSKHIYEFALYDDDYHAIGLIGNITNLLVDCRIVDNHAQTLLYNKDITKTEELYSTLIDSINNYVKTVYGDNTEWIIW